MYPLGFLEGGETEPVPVQISLYDITISSELLSRLTLLPDGTLQTMSNDSVINYASQWATKKFANLGASYEARITIDEGVNFTSGYPVNEWVSLAQPIFWELYTSFGITISTECTLEIRPTGGSVVASSKVTFIAGLIVPTISITNKTIVGDDFARIEFHTDGSLHIATEAGTTPIEGEWSDKTVTNLGNFYEVRMTKSQGPDPTNGTLNTWLPLTSNVIWDLIDDNTYIESFVGTVSIRQTGTTLVLDSAQITLTSGTVVARPEASNVTIIGELEVGQTVNGNYTYSHPLSIPEGASTYQWYRASDDTGTDKVAISGATSLIYTPDPADEGQYLQFEVTPKTVTGTVGLAAASSYVGPIAATVIPLPATMLSVTQFASQPRMTSYTEDDGEFVAIDPLEGQPINGIHSAGWSPDGQYFALGCETDMGLPILALYKRSGVGIELTSIPAELEDLGTPSRASGLMWSPNSRYLAVGLAGSHGTDSILVFDYQSGTPVKVALPSLPTVSAIRDIAWTRDSRYLIASSSSSAAYLFVYDFAGGSPVRVTVPAPAPADTVSKVFTTPDSLYLICNQSSNTFVWQFTESTLTPVTSGNLFNFFNLSSWPGYHWNPAGDILLRTDGKAFTWANNEATELTTVWAGGSLLSESMILVWSSDGQFIARAISTGVIAIYAWNDGTPLVVPYSGGTLGQTSALVWRPIEE